MRKTQLWLGALVIGSALLAGCAPMVVLDPAADANNPECAEIIVRLPDTVAEQPKRSVNAQSTAAWGEPVAVILRCGLEPVEISALPCVTASEVDWLIDDSNAPSFRFISYARFPATEVIIDSTVVAGVTVLEQLAASVGVLEATKRCTEITN
jgi:outer membrane murein-binding lipoprotein Lpp